jgi:ABC-2 type transport system permease protein
VNTLRLALRQLRYVNKAFWRNPPAAFFTFAFPLIFLVIFTSLLGHGTIQLGSRSINVSTYYVASMGSFSLISACFTNLALSISFQRDTDILKRLDATPLTRASYFTSRVLHALFVSILLIAITAAFGATFYHASVPSGITLVRFLTMLLVGAASFSALGVAATIAVPNANAGPAVVNAMVLPLLFLSGIFIPLGNSAPSWIVWVARIFPIRHFALGMQSGFVGTGFQWSDVLVVGLWGLGALVVAARYFRFEPRH